MMVRMRMTALALVATASLTAGAAQAQEGSWLGPLFMNLLGGGSSGPEIEYRDRAPLVVPPRSTLPSPQDQRAREDANWPRDPDVERRRKAEEFELIPSFLTGREAMMGDRGVRRLSNEELARGRIAPGASQGSDPFYQPSGLLDDRPGRALTSDPIRQMRDADAQRRAADAAMPVGREPPRRTLADPPVGLRSGTQRVQATQEPVRVEDRGIGIRDFQQQQRRN